VVKQRKCSMVELALDLAGWKPALLDGGCALKMAKLRRRALPAFVGQEAYTTSEDDLAGWKGRLTGLLRTT